MKLIITSPMLMSGEAKKYSSRNHQPIKKLRPNFFKLFFFPAGIYLFKFSNKNARKRRRRLWRRSRISIVNYEHSSHLFLVFLLLTLQRYMFAWMQCVSYRPSHICWGIVKYKKTEHRFSIIELGTSELRRVGTLLITNNIFETLSLSLFQGPNNLKLKWNRELFI